MPLWSKSDRKKIYRIANKEYQKTIKHLKLQNKRLKKELDYYDNLGKTIIAENRAMAKSTVG